MKLQNPDPVEGASPTRNNDGEVVLVAVRKAEVARQENDGKSSRKRRRIQKETKTGDRTPKQSNLRRIVIRSVQIPSRKPSKEKNAAKEGALEKKESEWKRTALPDAEASAKPKLRSEDKLQAYRQRKARNAREHRLQAKERKEKMELLRREVVAALFPELTGRDTIPSPEEFREAMERKISAAVPTVVAERSSVQSLQGKMRTGEGKHGAFKGQEEDKTERPFSTMGKTTSWDEQKSEGKDQLTFIESLMSNYAKANTGVVSGLGSGTYGVVLTVKGTTEKAIKLLRPERYFHAGVESEVDIGKYTKGMKNVMQYSPVYTREPIGVLMNRLTFDLEQFLKIMHYRRWSMFHQTQTVLQKYAKDCEDLKNGLRKLDLVSLNMIKDWANSERRLAIRGGSESVPLVEMEVLSLFIQLANGVQELHNARFLHGDIKARNVLVKLPSASPKESDETEKGYSCPEGEYFLADLGGAMRWNPGTCGWSFEEGRLPSATRTIMAPELWGVRYERRGHILSSSDIWSLGCTMLDVWIFVFGKVSEHPAGYFILPWMRGAYEQEGDRSWVKRCWTEARSIWRPRDTNREFHQGRYIDEWDVVKGGLTRGYGAQGEGKYELRKSLLYFILNCLLQPAAELRFSAQEVLDTLRAWRTELRKVTQVPQECAVDYSRAQEEIRRISLKYGEIVKDSKKIADPCISSPEQPVRAELRARTRSVEDSEAQRPKATVQRWGRQVPAALPWNQRREGQGEERRRAKNPLPYEAYLKRIQRRP